MNVIYTIVAALCAYAVIMCLIESFTNALKRTRRWVSAVAAFLTGHEYPSVAFEGLVGFLVGIPLFCIFFVLNLIYFVLVFLSGLGGGAGPR